MTASATTDRAYDEIDLSSPAFWEVSAAERERSFAILRAERPVSWHAPAEKLSVFPPDPNDTGYWAVTRHADILTVSRHNDIFVSGQGVMFASYPQEVMHATMSILAMDPPRHTKLRKLVSAAFTPRQIQRIEHLIVANARDVVRNLAAAGSGADFVEHCSERLPILTLAHMIGIPENERQKVAETAQSLIAASDPAFAAGRDPLAIAFEGTMYIAELAHRLADERREKPSDDLMTNLVQVDVDDEKLTNDEIAAFFNLLMVAGNDTTRQTTSHTLRALTDHPDQRAWLLADFGGRSRTAVEEFVRYSSPVMTFRRTAVAEVTLGGQRIMPGEKVVMFYPSGNWDTEVFTDPDRFDLSRDPNPHIGFGGGGAHFCLGSNLARAQLRALFYELLTQLPEIRAGEPKFLTSNLIHGIRSMPCYF